MPLLEQGIQDGRNRRSDGLRPPHLTRQGRRPVRQQFVEPGGLILGRQAALQLHGREALAVGQQPLRQPGSWTWRRAAAAPG